MGVDESEGISDRVIPSTHVGRGRYCIIVLQWKTAFSAIIEPFRKMAAAALVSECHGFGPYVN